MKTFWCIFNENREWQFPNKYLRCNDNNKSKTHTFCKLQLFGQRCTKPTLTNSVFGLKGKKRSFIRFQDKNSKYRVWLSLRCTFRYFFRTQQNNKKTCIGFQSQLFLLISPDWKRIRKWQCYETCNLIKKFFSLLFCLTKITLQTRCLKFSRQ